MGHIYQESIHGKLLILAHYMQMFLHLNHDNPENLDKNESKTLIEKIKSLRDKILTGSEESDEDIDR